MYFQYCNDSLIGFVYGTTQYYYVTNLSGDIVGITDADGNLIAEYEYDEWGKLLSIKTAEEGNAEQQKVAERNPFRYRGYYYDSETGMYYLNSRYYNPELGRFISADSFNYIKSSTRIGLNAYCYCANNPIMYSDPTGNKWVSDLGIQIAEIFSVIMATWDAFEQGGKDFAAMIATALTFDTSILYQPGKNHYEQHLNFEKWINEMFGKFQEFSEKTFYKFVKFFNDNFFVDFSKELLENKVSFYFSKINEAISVFLGFGNNDSMFASLLDILDGHFELINNNNVSSGLIFKLKEKCKEIGVYFQVTFERIKDFYYGYVFDLSVELPRFDNFNTPDFPLGVTDNFNWLPSVAPALIPYVVYILFICVGAGMVLA